MSTKGAMLHFAKTQQFAVTVQQTPSDIKLSSQRHTKIPCLHKRYDSLYKEELSCISAITDKRYDSLYKEELSCISAITDKR